jgi:hypothetical protein
MYSTIGLPQLQRFITVSFSVSKYYVIGNGDRVRRVFKYSGADYLSPQGLFLLGLKV